MPRFLNRADRIAWRQMKGIERQVKALQDKLPTADRDLLIRFARGHKALSAYETFLNEDGQSLLTRVSALAEAPEIDQIKEVLPELPSVKAPQLQLYKRPFTNETLKDPTFRAFKAEFNRARYSIIQIASGCQNFCLMCGAHENGKPKPVKFMPFPMVLLLAAQLVEKKSQARFLSYFNSDPLQWRDYHFDADYGDLAIHLKDLGMEFHGATTLGFWPGDAYAEEAAIKCRENNIDFRLSVHLFHKKLFPHPGAEPADEMLDRYAERFVHTIKQLRPDKITYRSDDQGVNQYWTSQYLKQFINERIQGREEIRFLSDREYVELRMFLSGNVDITVFLYLFGGETRITNLIHALLNRRGYIDCVWLGEWRLTEKFTGKREEFKLSDPLDDHREDERIYGINQISQEDEDKVFSILDDLYRYSPNLSEDEIRGMICNLAGEYGSWEIKYEGRVIDSKYFPNAPHGYDASSIFGNINLRINTDGSISVLVFPDEIKTKGYVLAPTVEEAFCSADNDEFGFFLRVTRSSLLEKPNKTVEIWQLLFPSAITGLHDFFRSIGYLTEISDWVREKAFSLLRHYPVIQDEEAKYEIVLPFKAFDY